MVKNASAPKMKKDGTPRKKPERSGVNATMFVVEWQRSSSLKDFCKRTNMTPQAASGRAVSYRKQGVPLKEMEGKRGPSVDWQDLAKLAKSTELEAKKAAKSR